MDISFSSRFGRIWPALALTGLIAIALFIPAAWVEDVPSPPEPPLHFLFFFALAGVWLHALPRWRKIVTAAVFLAAFGTEAIQAVAVAGRTAALDDLIGNLLGVGAAWLVTRWRLSREIAKGAPEKGRKGEGKSR